MKPANYAPVYCALYPQLTEIARSHGYAMAVHGSMARDMDACCIPWVEEPSEPQVVVDEIVKKFAISQIRGWSIREHGREVTTLSIAFGECFIDLSFMPRIKGVKRTDMEKLHATYAPSGMSQEEFAEMWPKFVAWRKRKSAMTLNEPTLRPSIKDTLNQLAADPEKAKALLDEVGITNGDGQLSPEYGGPEWPRKGPEVQS